MAVGAGEAAFSSDADKGDFDRDPFAPAFRNGDPVRLTTGGVPVRDGGLLGRLIDGLSHEEKKSSSGSPAGVLEPSDGVPTWTSVMTTSPGYLGYVASTSLIATAWSERALTVAHPAPPAS